MILLWKVQKQENFEWHSCHELSFTNIQGLLSKFGGYEYLLELNSPDNLVLCEANLDDAIDTSNFSVTSYLF